MPRPRCGVGFFSHCPCSEWFCGSKSGQMLICEEKGGTKKNGNGMEMDLSFMNNYYRNIEKEIGKHQH